MSGFTWMDLEPANQWRAGNRSTWAFDDVLSARSMLSISAGKRISGSLVASRPGNRLSSVIATLQYALRRTYSVENQIHHSP
jgi:hypothetical protein